MSLRDGWFGSWVYAHLPREDQVGPRCWLRHHVDSSKGEEWIAEKLLLQGKSVNEWRITQRVPPLCYGRYLFSDSMRRAGRDLKPSYLGPYDIDARVSHTTCREGW